MSYSESQFVQYQVQTYSHEHNQTMTAEFGQYCILHTKQRAKNMSYDPWHENYNNIFKFKFNNIYRYLGSRCIE